MIIRFERTSGFTAIIQRMAIDTDMMAPEARRSLMALLEPVGFFRLPAQIISPGERTDRFFYRLTIEDAQRTHTIEVGETGMPESLHPLIEHLSALARQAR